MMIECCTVVVWLSGDKCRLSDGLAHTCIGSIGQSMNAKLVNTYPAVSMERAIRPADGVGDVALVMHSFGSRGRSDICRASFSAI